MVLKLSLLFLAGVARVLNHQRKLGEKVVVTCGDKMRPSGHLKYDLELRESDAVGY